MRVIILLISTCVIVHAQDCGSEDTCFHYSKEVVAGSPCWRLKRSRNENEYCHIGKNLTITATNNDKTAIINCGNQILDCSWLPTLDFAKNGQLEKLKFSNCSMNGSISCVLRALNVTVLTHLDLKHWKTNITKETVKGLNGLKTFMVFDSDALTRIPVEVFKQLPALQEIRMSGNSISDIPAQVFLTVGDMNITYLEISRAKIAELQSGAFQGLQRLICLNLQENEIKTVDKDAFKGLPLIKSLVLKNNSIEDLPAGVFSPNPDLEILDIQANRVDLKLKNGTLAGLTKLQRLDLTMYNESYRLSLEDQSLSGLPSLKYCDLSKAGLLELPKDLFKGNIALEKLFLDYNELRLLPANVFKDLENLKELSLSNNKLQDEIAKSSSNNKGPFSTTSKLETLNLASNELKSLSVQLFAGASSLKTLNISYNQLYFECRSSFFDETEGIKIERFILHESPLDNLQRTLLSLDLSHNNLTSICRDFLNSRTLKELNLSYNKIPALTWEEINFLGNGTVDLRFNQITSISPRSLEVTLLLGNNPYNCDCKNFKLIKKLKSLKYDMSEAICSEPKSLKRVPLISIAESRNFTSLDNLTCVLSDTPKNCECLARPSLSMTECACDEVVTNLPDPNNKTMHYLIDQEIETKYNMFLKLKKIDNLENIPNFVTNLSLSNITLKTIPNIPEHIRYVDLTYNDVEEIPIELLSSNTTFSLNNNPFPCTCGGQKYINNLQINRDKILDYSSLKCHDGIGDVQSIQVRYLCDEDFSIVIASTIVGIGLGLAVLVILAYKYQLEIKIWLYNQGWTFGLFNYENALDASKKYDIFLSYCHEDEAYVINKLLPFMDAKYKVCVHTRDFIPGYDIMTQIYGAVADSKRTVIVASKAYFKSPWCLEEMRAAYKQTEVDQRTRAVVILRTDVDPKSEDISETVRSYLNLNTWIGEKDSRFWYRLCYFLPRDVTVEDLRLIEVTNEAKKNLSGTLNKVFVHDGKLGIDNETGEVNGNLARNICGVQKDVPALNDEVQLATNNLPRGLDAVPNNGKLAQNLPETLNVERDEYEKLVNVAVVK